MDQQARDSGKIIFLCPSCGVRLTVRETLAGKQGRCPKCKRMAPVPPAQTRDATAETAGTSDVTVGKSPLYDLRLLDIHPNASPPVSTGDSGGGEAAYRELQMLQGARLPGKQDEAPRRKLPWILDIFLYPLSRAGLSILLISVGIPFVLRVIVRFFFFFMGSFPPVFVFWVLFIILHWGVFAFFVLYVNWYFCECIRDSAAGGIRAVDTTATTPGLGEILGQAMKVILSAAVCLAPALIYLNQTRSADSVFRILYAAGGFLIPMGVLAMVMFDAIHGLNPLVLLGSILKTLFQYCALVAFCYISCLLVPVAGYYIVTSWIRGSALLLVTFYQLLILAHLLGRFYWRNEARLNWDA